MSQKVLSFLVATSLVSWSAFADADLGGQIETVNQEVKSVGNINGDCVDCDSSADLYEPPSIRSQKIAACVESICTDPTFSLTKEIDESARKADIRQSTMLDHFIAPLVTKIIDNEIKAKIQRTEKVLEWLQKPHVLDKPDDARLFNYINLLQDFRLVKYKSVKDGKGQNRIAIDGVRTRAGFSGLTSVEFQKRLSLFYHLVPMFNEMPFSETDPATVRLLYPNNKLKEKVVQEIEKILAIQKKLNADPAGKLLLLTSEVDPGQRLQNILKETEPNPENLEYINLLFFQYKLIDTFRTDETLRGKLSARPVDIDQFVRRNKVMDVLTARSEALSFESKKLVSDDLNWCRTTYWAGQDLLPSEAEVKRFEARLPSLKDEFKSTLGHWMSTHSAARVGPLIDAWKPNYPITKAQHERLMLKSLQEIATESDKLIKSQTEIDNSGARDLAYATTIAISKLNSEAGAQFDDLVMKDSLIRDACTSLFPNPLPDRAYGGGLAIGPFTVRWANAEGFVFHEMAHLLEDELRKHKADISLPTLAWQGKAKACLQKANTGMKSPDQYQREDWADMIAAHASKKYSNFACSFSRSVRPGHYDKMGFKTEESHSGDFFRVLHVEFLRKGSLNPACQAAVASIGENTQFKDCAVQK